MIPIALSLLFVLGLVLLYRGRPYLAWTFPVAGALGIWAAVGAGPTALFILVLMVGAGLAALFGIPPLRRRLVTRPIFRIMARILPRVSETERQALEAGTVWWDAELFSGRPDWARLAAFRVEPLCEKERAFLDGPVEELCRLLDDDRIAREGDLPPEVWSLLRGHRFFGMIIPEEHGGLGFSAQAHSAVVVKLASRCSAAAVTVMVPNSLGPAELILHHGTEEQKRHYLPRLARGEEVPCFALTEPEAGSDATAGKSEGTVCLGFYQGREVLGIRLHWNKRYATLAPVATVIGLAFRLRDPQRLLGGGEDPGITCALVPAHLPGVEIGRRHDPLGVPFLNGPTTGRDVFIPADFIIGGPAMAGLGWRMLMESLAAGRSISLPALATGGAQLCTRVTGAYATVREQFGLPIGRFEGVEERLGRIAGLTYLMNATRRLTAGAVDAGEKPAVVSAMVKVQMTELMREVVNDAMDVTAGSGISRGPRNTLAMAYASVPIGITVEGANILTRCLIVFGQGAIRCHPCVLEEIRAVADQDLVRFDRAFFRHLGLVARNGWRAFVLGATRGRPARPGLAGPLGPCLGQLSRLSACFAFLADLCMAALGADLKRREMLSGRMADALGGMYLASAVAKDFVDDGSPEEDLPFARWAMETTLYRTSTAMEGVLDNFPGAWVRLCRPVLFPPGSRLRPPSDRLTALVGRAIQEGNPGRERLTRDIFVPRAGTPGLGTLEEALAKTVAARPVEEKLKDAVRRGRIARASGESFLASGIAAGIITPEEARLWDAAVAARREAIQVDSFPGEALTRGRNQDGGNSASS